jgi:hypothetical protein
MSKMKTFCQETHSALFNNPKIVKLKGKVVPVLLTEHHTMKMYWGVEVKLHAFLTSTLNGGE